MKIIGHIESDFPTNFGIPRQSGIAKSLMSKIVFEPCYRVREAFRGLEKYSHIWVIWQFSDNKKDEWSPTVRPPKLGGNKRVGVFATRSPYRPNRLGLSSVKLEKIDLDAKDGPILYISGADMQNGTPVYDIKPYIAYTDSHPDSISGFALAPDEKLLEVEIPTELLAKIPQNKREALVEILRQDPRPGYITDDRRCGFPFAGLEIGFFVKDDILFVTEVSLGGLSDR